MEIEEVVKALESGWITTGPRTKELEKRLAKYIGVSAYTYSASASAAIHVGAKVVFVDTQKDSCVVDYDAVGKAITEKTKAVIPVDIAGIPCDYDRLYEVVEFKRILFFSVETLSWGKDIKGSRQGSNCFRLRIWHRGYN